MLYQVKPKTALLIVPLLLAASSLLAQPPKPDRKTNKRVTKYFDRLQLLIKKNALVADSIDWKQLNRQVEDKLPGVATIQEAKPVLEHILSALRSAGDKHSGFVSSQNVATRTASSYAGQQAQSAYLGSGIGYLKIPALGSINSGVGLSFSQRIRDQLNALATQHTLTGWVIDLRHNTGGNLQPMIEGIQTLLGQQPYGYFIYPRHKKEISLQSQSQPIGQGEPTTKPVAVLIDSRTGSSGEMVAIALKGLAHTKCFGQASAGYTTVNQTFTLPDGTYLLLATGYLVDRNHNAYLGGLIPDVMVESSADAAQDKPLEAAKAWLLEAKPLSVPK